MRGGVPQREVWAGGDLWREVWAPTIYSPQLLGEGHFPAVLMKMREQADFVPIVLPQRNLEKENKI